MKEKTEYSTTSSKCETDVEDAEEKSFIEEIKIYFRNFCNHTSIHGFQYFGQHRTLIEKFWWIIVFCVAITGCAFCIYLIYDKWATSPVIVSLATKETPIYQIPFPAVTICPTIKYSRKCLKKLESSIKNKSREKLMKGYLQTLCKNPLKTKGDSVSKDQYLSDHFFRIFLECSPLASHNYSVKFMNEHNLKFNQVFHPIITEDGICYSFNIMSAKEIFSDEIALYPGLGMSDGKSHWVPQVGYPEDTELETYPRRALLAGGLNSLEITMEHSEKDIDYFCNGAEQGYKVLLHIPSRIARPALEYILVPFNRATTITVIPEMMSTSSRVQKYEPATRNCYFPKEKQLKYYKEYTKTSCDIECLTNYTLHYCKCVAFWMPRNKTTSICGPTRFFCVQLARENYDLSQLKDKLKEERLRRRLAAAKTNHTIESLKFWEGNDNRAVEEEIRDLEDEIIMIKSKCNCYPICSDITYVGTASSLDFRRDQGHQDAENYRNDTIWNSSANGVTQMSIFIKSNEIFTRERNELYGPTDFISNFGGLLGLFSGFSMLSVMEIVYFLTFRIIGNWKKFGRWYGKED